MTHWAATASWQNYCFTCTLYRKTTDNFTPPAEQLRFYANYSTSLLVVVSHLKGTAIVYKPHVLRRCLSSQGTSMYPRVHEDCWATVASSQNCETISGHYKSYYGTSHLYHGFQRCMEFVPSCSCMSSLGLRPREDIQLPSGTNLIHLETHGTNITCMLTLLQSNIERLQYPNEK